MEASGFFFLLMDSSMRSIEEASVRDAALIRRLLARDGVAVVRHAVPIRLLRDLKMQLEQAFVDVSLVRRSRGRAKPDRIQFAHPDASRRSEEAMRRAHLIPEYHLVPQHPRVRRFWDALFDGEAFTHPKAALRVAVPSASEVTSAHQDFSYQPSSKNCTALWVPLHDVAPGVLEFVLGSHRRGPLTAAQAAALAKRSQWSTAALRVGDAFVFGCLTLHRAPPNRMSTLRCSVDFRAQPMTDPVLEALLADDLILPFGLSWEEVYEKLPADFDRKYFWRDRHPPVATNAGSRAASDRAVELSRLVRFERGDRTQLEHIRWIGEHSKDAKRRSVARRLLEADATR
jgi:hypothetical protein